MFYRTATTVDGHYIWAQTSSHHPKEGMTCLTSFGDEMGYWVEWTLGWSLETGLYVEGYNGQSFSQENLPENWEMV